MLSSKIGALHNKDYTFRGGHCLHNAEEITLQPIQPRTPQPETEVFVVWLIRRVPALLQSFQDLWTMGSTTHISP